MGEEANLYMPPELLEMSDPSTELVYRSINPRLTPNIGKMVLLGTKKEDLRPGCKEPNYMLGPESKNLSSFSRVFKDYL